MRYELIAPANLHSAWTDVLRGLKRILEKSPERWLPEDVYAHIKIGLAKLYLAFDPHYRGFFIVEVKHDMFTNEKYLGVWCLYAEPQLGNRADVAQFVPETIGYLDAMARANECTRIQCEGRPGWSEYLKGYFRVSKVKYERAIV